MENQRQEEIKKILENIEILINEHMGLSYNFDQYINPYDGTFKPENKDKEIEYNKVVEDFIKKVEIIMAPIPEGDQFNYMYELWEYKIALKEELFSIMFPEMARLEYHKKGITVNKADPTSGIELIIVNPKNKKRIRFTDVYGYTCEFGFMEVGVVKEDINNYEKELKQIKKREKQVAKKLGIQVFSMEGLLMAEELNPDYYHGQTVNPYEEPDPMGCLADYE